MPSPAPASLGSADSEAYWSGLERGSVQVQRCGRCGRHQFYPTSVCRYCHSRDVALVPVAGTGTLVTSTVVRRAPTAEFRDQLPYVDGLVALDEGPIVMCRLTGQGTIDARGSITVAAADDRSRLLLQFHPDGEKREAS